MLGANLAQLHILHSLAQVSGNFMVGDPAPALSRAMHRHKAGHRPALAPALDRARTQPLSPTVTLAPVFSLALPQSTKKGFA